MMGPGKILQQFLDLITSQFNENEIKNCTNNVQCKELSFAKNIQNMFLKEVEGCHKGEVTLKDSKSSNNN